MLLDSGKAVFEGVIPVLEKGDVGQRFALHGAQISQTGPSWGLVSTS